MEIMLNKPRTLFLQPNEIALILDALSEKPFKQVNGLVSGIFAQLKQQEKDDEVRTGNGSGPVDVGVQPPQSAD